MPALATLWPWRGSGASEGLLLAVSVGLLLAAVPAAWVLLRRRCGPTAAGPLWPLLVFIALSAVYAVATPPWQTADEPQHMVHVEVVRRAGLTAPHQLLPGSRASAAARAALAATDRDIVASMRATDASRWLPDGAPALAANVVPGPRELSHPPLYYTLAAIMSSPLAGAGVLARLAVLRALGVLFGAITVWACGAAGRLLWPGRRLAQAPMVVVLAIPTFVALAGSVNNDGLAVVCGSLLITLLLAGVLDRGPWARPLLWAVGAGVLVAAGVETKRTFLPLALLVVLAVAIRLRKRPAVTVGVLAACVLVVAVAFGADSSPRLALWEQQTSSVSYRCHDPAAGTWAICLPGGAPSIVQKIPLVRARAMEGLPFELAFSARSDEQPQAMVIDVATPSGVLAARRVDLGTDARLAVLAGVVPAHVDALWVETGAPAGATVYVRDMRLTATRLPALGGALTPARNEVRNGSGDQAVAGAPGFLPDSLQREVNSAIDAVAGVGLAPGLVVSSVPILYDRMATAFAMFWATVGWQIPPPLFPVGLNWALAILTAVAIGGAAVALLRTRLPAFPGALLLFTATVMTVAVTFRNIPPDEPGVVNGRYLFPAITAFVVILAAGWQHLWPGTDRSFRVVTRAAVPVMHLLFVAVVFVPFLTK